LFVNLKICRQDMLRNYDKIASALSIEMYEEKI